MAQLALALLGPLQVTLDGVSVAGFESQKVRALLAYLAVEADRPHARDALAGLLWPNQSDHNARTNLRQALANLRLAIGDQHTIPSYLHVTSATIQFNRASDHRIDMVAFRERLDACDQHPHRHLTTCRSCAQRLQQAIDLYRGDFLAGFFLADCEAFEEWVLLTREQLRQCALAALIQLTGSYERRGEYGYVHRTTQRHLELDPWREASHRQLMRILAASGERSAALMQYEMCRRVLKQELGVEPEAETTALYAQIRAGAVPANGHATLPPTNLAAYTPLTPLIGRDAERAQLADRLENRNCRLLTLVGPGGVGKTRLALAVAVDLHDSFPDGVYFVALASLNAAEFVVPTIAGALGFMFHGLADTKTQLFAHLQAKDLLLVLDNFEQITDGAPLVGELLAVTPGLTVLITSRMPLHLSGEHEMVVPSLAVPGPAQPRQSVLLGDYDAVRLFVTRAQAVNANFRLTDEYALAVAAICIRLDGLPLAIELAAARLKLFTPTALRARLARDGGLGMLTGGPHDHAHRQQTMRATIAWSYQLLHADEQRLLRRLAVFVGGWTLEAAEAVCGEQGFAQQPGEQTAQRQSSGLPVTSSVIDGMTALLDQSLLQQIEGSGGEPRFTMLETIREYALERLVEAGEVETLRERHVAYLLAFVEQVAAEFSGSKQVVWLARMRAEHANHRAALEWAVQHGAIETGVRLATMWWWGGDPAPVTEARMWLEKLFRQGSSLPISVRAQMLMTMADLAINQYDYPSAQTLLEESLVLFRTIGDVDRIATILRMLGHVAIGRGDHRQALEFLTESRDLLLELENTVSLAMSLLGLGVVLSLQGDYAQAIALCTESLALGQKCGNTLLMAWTFKHLGNLAQRQGDAGQARELLANSLALFQDAGDMVGIMAYLEGMAEVAGLEGEPERLVQLFGAVVPLHISLGVTSYPAEQAAYEQQLLAAHAQLGEGAYALAWDAGRAMTVEQAVAETLLTRVTRARG